MKWTGERVVAWDMHDSVHTYQEHLIRYVFALQYCARKRVLDAACGSGYGSDLIGNVAEAVTGVDISVEALEYARAEYVKPSFEYMDLEQPDFSGFQVDVVLSFETIEHLADPHPFLRSVRSAVGKGGIFIWSIPRMMPSDYHKVVYDFKEATELISGYFPKTLYLRQDKDGVSVFAPDYGPYFLGVSRA